MLKNWCNLLIFNALFEDLKNTVFGLKEVFCMVFSEIMNCRIIA
ncbi:hypothetical protein AB46_0304 [Escherichia coli 3-267-03_S1_C2]|nr:hypothetical protein AB46_0304 [Escherichia coli 3-267-03_S1_C2]